MIFKKIVAKSKVVTKFNVPKSKLHCCITLTCQIIVYDYVPNLVGEGFSQKLIIFVGLNKGEMEEIISFL
jgi:hypothetical protein